MSTGQDGAINLLAQLLAALSTVHDEISMDEIASSPSGVSAKVFLPSGDTYIVVVQWVGDREGER